MYKKPIIFIYSPLATVGQFGSYFVEFLLKLASFSRSTPSLVFERITDLTAFLEIAPMFLKECEKLTLTVPQNIFITREQIDRLRSFNKAELIYQIDNIQTVDQKFFNHLMSREHTLDFGLYLKLENIDNFSVFGSMKEILKCTRLRSVSFNSETNDINNELLKAEKLGHFLNLGSIICEIPKFPMGNHLCSMAESLVIDENLDLRMCPETPVLGNIKNFSQESFQKELFRGNLAYIRNCLNPCPYYLNHHHINETVPQKQSTRNVFSREIFLKAANNHYLNAKESILPILNEEIKKTFTSEEEFLFFNLVSYIFRTPIKSEGNPEYETFLKSKPFSPYHLTYLGFLNLREKKLEEAYFKFKKAVYYDEKFSDAIGGEGFVFLLKKKYHRARITFLKGLFYNQENLFCNIGLGLLDIFEKKYFNATHYLWKYKENQVFWSLTELITYFDANSTKEILLKKGEAYILNGLFWHEIERIKKELAKEQLLPAEKTILGLIHKKDLENDIAHQFFSLAIKENDMIPEAHSGIGMIFLDNQNKDGALGYFQKALSLNPNDYLGNLGMGWIEFDKKNMAMAERYFSEAYGPKTDERLNAYCGIAWIRLFERRYEEALKIFKEILNKSPENPMANTGLYNLYKELGSETEMKRLEITGNVKMEMRTPLMRLSVKLSEDIVPKFFNLGVTDDCMLKCQMCHKWKGNGARTNQIPLQKWKEVIDSIKDVNQGEVNINFAGGEPLYSEWTYELIRHASDYGFKPALCTNGFLLSKNNIEKLSAARLNLIAISLDSLEEEKHDRWRGVKGVYKNIMNGLELFEKLENNIIVEIQPLIMAQNLEDILPLADWVNRTKRIQGVNFLSIIQPHNTEKNNSWQTSTEYKNLWPEKEKVIEVLDGLIERKKQGFKISNPIVQLEIYKNYYANPMNFIKKRKKCMIGNWFLNVSFKGEIDLCPYIEGINTRIGNITEKSLKEIWFSEEADKVRQEMYKCEKNCYLLLNCCFEAD